MKWITLLLALVASNAFVPVVQNQARLQTTRVFSEAVADGLVKTVTKPGNGMPVQLGDIATVKYSCYLPNDPKAAPFSKANSQKVVRWTERDYALAFLSDELISTCNPSLTRH